MITIYRGGYNSRHPKSFILSRPNGLNRFVFLLVRSKASFQIREESFTVEPNTVFIIRPGVPYRYSALDSEYRNDWMHFDSTEDSFVTEYERLFNRPIPLSDGLMFAQYIQHIIWEQSYADAKYRDRNITMLFQVLMNKLLQELDASHKPGAYNPYASRLQALRLTMQSQPYKNFTPAELAGKLHVSSSYFQFLYKEFFGTPFKADLIHMRLEYAMELITNTTLSLEQIALMSGYSNEIHFYRQFKKKTGMTPREYQVSMKPKQIE